MRRIVLGFMGTLSGLVLLFSYHTSTSSRLVVASGATDTSPGTTGAMAAPSTTTPSTGSSSTPSTSSSSPSSSPSSSSPSSGSAAPTTSAAAPAPTASSPGAAAAGTYTGSAANTRWGIVQVQITVANGKITASTAVQYPQNNGRDVQINSYAVPALNQEVVAAQSANIDTVSGATVTSDGYLQSLQSALNQAHL